MRPTASETGTMVGRILGRAMARRGVSMSRGIIESYVDAGDKAAMCVAYDRHCDDIMRRRDRLAQSESESD